MSPDGTQPNSVGRVTWGCHYRRTAELFDDGSWRVTHRGRDDPGTARDLAAIYRAWERDPGTPYGHGILPDLARLMGGSYVLHLSSPARGP